MIIRGEAISSGKLIPTPTVMKKSPINSPLNGCKSASNWWRNSELASTTPATKVPSAGDMPTSIIRKAMPSTISNEMKVDISGSRAAWTKRNTGRLRKCPASTIPATMASVSRATAQAGIPCTSENSGSASPSAVSTLPAAGPRGARKGMIARIGTTARSWVSSTANEARPPGVRIRPFSDRVCSTMAVDDIAPSMPRITATCHAMPSSTAAPATAAMVSPTCNPPMPISFCRMSHSACGRSSNPIRNSISTTPNSANSCRSLVSAPASPMTGPIRMPAAR